ncbi:hypothetical protein [Streptomyces avicenniae]|uniref:hypothetical protein n=1 Tax=Streptomyces avicenniae TaxID=500153 RepID=UPI00069C47DF|nr:hypothetical protein [Streptomyces avicenniae]
MHKPEDNDRNKGAEGARDTTYTTTGPATETAPVYGDTPYAPQGADGFGDGRFGDTPPEGGSTYGDGQFLAGELADGLIPAPEAARLRAELQHAVGAFVDSPKQSVAEADTVLEAAVARIAASLDERRRAMRTTWDGNGNGGNGNGDGAHHDADGLDTEKWRVIMLDYRDTMERLLSA